MCKPGRCTWTSPVSTLHEWEVIASDEDTHSHLSGGKFQNAFSTVLLRILSKTELQLSTASNSSVAHLLWFPLFPCFKSSQFPVCFLGITVLKKLHVHKLRSGSSLEVQEKHSNDGEHMLLSRCNIFHVIRKIF